MREECRDKVELLKFEGKAPSVRILLRQANSLDYTKRLDLAQDANPSLAVNLPTHAPRDVVVAQVLHYKVVKLDIDGHGLGYLDLLEAYDISVGVLDVLVAAEALKEPADALTVPGDNLDLIWEQSIPPLIRQPGGPRVDPQRDWVLLLEDVLRVNVYPFLILFAPRVPRVADKRDHPHEEVLIIDPLLQIRQQQ